MSDGCKHGLYGPCLSCFKEILEFKEAQLKTLQAENLRLRESLRIAFSYAKHEIERREDSAKFMTLNDPDYYEIGKTATLAYLDKRKIEAALLTEPKEEGDK